MVPIIVICFVIMTAVMFLKTYPKFKPIKEEIKREEIQNDKDQSWIMIEENVPTFSHSRT